MAFLDGLARRAAGLLRRKAVEREMDDEMRFHLEMQAEDNIRSGMAPEDARKAAHQVFGPVAKAKELCREQKGLPTLESVLQDLGTEPGNWPACRFSRLQLS